MARHFLAPHPVFGRKNKRLPVSYQRRSPYYWWWQYLRRNRAYLDCCEGDGKGSLASLYADFGDVREDNFHRWWTEGGRGVHLFAERPLTINFCELESPADWQPHWTKDTAMVLVVPLRVSKRRLKGVFAKYLDRRHGGKKSGRPSMAAMMSVSTARYKLEHNYTIAGLATALAVYDEWTKNQSSPASQQLTLWQIAEKLNLNRSAIKDAVSANKQDRMTGRNTLAATVSRYVRQAGTMIENTSLGRFPAM